MLVKLKGAEHKHPSGHTPLVCSLCSYDITTLRTSDSLYRLCAFHCGYFYSIHTAPLTEQKHTFKSTQCSELKNKPLPAVQNLLVVSISSNIISLTIFIADLRLLMRGVGAWLSHQTDVVFSLCSTRADLCGVTEKENLPDTSIKSYVGYSMF